MCIVLDLVRNEHELAPVGARCYWPLLALHVTGPCLSLDDIGPCLALEVIGPCLTLWDTRASKLSLTRREDDGDIYR